MTEKPVPETLTLDEAFRAAFVMTDQYLEREREPDVGLLLFHQYLQSDPARWEDWRASIRRAIADGPGGDPLVEVPDRDD